MRFFTYWTGGPLSPYECLSLQSFIDHNHEISLYSDLSIETLKPPSGVRVIDADSIVHKSTLDSIRGSDGKHHHALKSDYFRFKKLSLDPSEIWVDLDIICLSDDWGSEKSINVGLEDLGMANSAVIGLGDHRELARELFARLSDMDLTCIPWGNTGPRLITNQLIVSGLLDKCLPIEAFYPISYRNIDILFDPESTTKTTELTAKSKAIHLWSEVMSQNAISKMSPPPPNSFLSQLFSKHKIHFESSEDSLDDKWLSLLRGRSKDLDYEKTSRINLQETNQNLQETNKKLQETNQNLQETNKKLEQESEKTRVKLVRKILELEVDGSTSVSMFKDASEEIHTLRSLNEEMTSSKAWRLALILREFAHPINFLRTKIGR